LRGRDHPEGGCPLPLLVGDAPAVRIRAVPRRADDLPVCLHLLGRWRTRQDTETATQMKEAGLAELFGAIDAAGRSVSAPSRLYLVSRTSHLAEGWCDRVPALELAGDGDRTELGEAVREAGRALGVDVVWESPADV